MTYNFASCHRTWTPEADAELISMYLKSSTYLMAAVERFGRTEPSIRSRIRVRAERGLVEKKFWPARWSAADVAELVERVNDDEQILCERFGRSWDAIQDKIWRLGRKGLCPSRTSRSESFWIDVEDDFVIANTNKLSPWEMAVRLHRTYQAVHGRQKFLVKVGRCEKPRRLRAECEYSEADDDFIRQMYGTMLNSLIGERLGRTAKSIGYRAVRLGVAKKKDQRFWPDDEVEVVKADWPNSSQGQIAKKLGRTRMSVVGQIKRMQDRGILCRKRETTNGSSAGAGGGTAMRCGDGPRLVSLQFVSTNAQRS